MTRPGSALPSGPGQTVLSPLARGDTNRFLERAAEGRFRLVADAFGDFGDALDAVHEMRGGQLHAPARQVLHRRLADEGGEPLGERGA
jgi:hypothetical protein